MMTYLLVRKKHLELKRTVKSLIPSRVRLWRYELYERGRYYPELLLSLGRTFECPFCLWRFRRLRPAGYEYPVLKEKQVIGASYHLNDVCPRCMSNSRERLLYLFLKNRTDLFLTRKSVLHLAPEPNIHQVLSRHTGTHYVSGDLYERDVMVQMDVMTTPFCDKSFDVIICSHVLEHVTNDLQAMKEFYRVLKAGGWAIFQVPIAMALTTTLEDPTATSDEQRIKLFGQRDHVRLYSQDDYVKRLESAGFDVHVEVYCQRLPQKDVRRYALISEEPVFLCKKPVAK